MPSATRTTEAKIQTDTPATRAALDRARWRELQRMKAASKKAAGK